ncbi:winged helix-turn-helix domain-containing protein [Pseudoalteromonas luteoviolacea]|uniref:winged helix-turn-helix domain-containing protein n=1 Tax=Pseudoalteromonas luteoviolacea TaxID=43657 RepID=UPI001F1AD1ED|nr:winged helix-turn-helix domain-containing protein [Pseudoalteromonas luteoviolacea]MCF6441077.1 winged helix-turn-helix domain-containing protein [Pseudoalteromonas luteoviolacea]
MKYIINGITFDTQQRTLSVANEQVYLEAKSFQLLSVFIANNHVILTRDTLIELAWDGRIVSDSAINKAISKLRQHLETLQPNSSIIQTKPKIGYVFSANVSTFVPQKKQRLNQATLFSICLFVFIAIVFYAIRWLLSGHDPIPSPLQLERLTAHAGIETRVSASFNGKFTYLNTNHADGTQHLYLKDLNAQQTHLLPITTAQLQSHSMSADGQYIAYVTQQEEHCSIKLHTIDALTNTDAFDCSNMANLKLAWQHDNKAIFIRSRENNASPFTIFKFLLNSQKLIQASLPAEHHDMKGDYLLAAHPKKRLFAFARYLAPDLTEVHLVNSKSLKTIQITEFAGAITAMGFGEDTLYFSEQQSLFQLDIDTKQIGRIKDTSYPIESLAITQVNDKNLLIHSQYHVSSEVKAFHIKRKQSRSLFDNAALNRLPQHTKKGHLMYVSNTEQQHDLWVMNNDQSTKLALPFEFGFRRYQSHPITETILFEKQGALLELDLNTHDLQQVIDPKHKAYVANYHDNGEQIIYSSNKQGEWQLWLFDRKKQSHTQLTNNGGYSGYYYQNQLYYTKRHVSGIWAIDQGKEQLLIPHVSNINWLNWRILAGNIYFYKKNDGIWQYNIETKQQQRILAQPDGFIHQYTINDDAITYIEIKPMQGDIHALTL